MEDLIRDIVEHVKRHVKRRTGAQSQEPYRSDWFALFIRAYKAGYCSEGVQGRLTGDRIGDLYAERKMAVDEQLNDDQWKIMTWLVSSWDNWRYALDKTDYR